MNGLINSKFFNILLFITIIGEFFASLYIEAFL